MAESPSSRAPTRPCILAACLWTKKKSRQSWRSYRAKRLFRFYGRGEGPSKVAALEQAFADFMGVKHTVAVTSGTAALTCGLHAIEVGPGDEVVVPAYTWIASAAAVIAVGAIPVVAEVDEMFLLDPADVEAKTHALH